MPSEPIHILLLRGLIYLGCALLGFVALGLVGVAMGAPIQAMVDGIGERFGTAGMLAFAALIPLSGYLIARWSERRHDRQQVAETGVLDHRRPVIAREGLGRNVAILLAPLALLATIGLAMWLTGTVLPPEVLR